MSEDFEGGFPTSGWRVLDGDGATHGEYYCAADDYLPHAGHYSAWPGAGGFDGVDPEF